MAVAIVTTRSRVCDVCGENGGVQRVRLTLLANGSGSSRTVTVDLCEKHLAPVKEAMDAKPAGTRKTRAVTPKKEVTARKRARKRA